MNVFILYSHYYDFCNQYDTILGIYDSEDKAIESQIREEENPQYGKQLLGEITN